MKGRGGGCLIPTLLSLEKAEVEYQYRRTVNTASKARVTVVLFNSAEANTGRSPSSIFLHHCASFQWCKCAHEGKSPQELINLPQLFE